MKKIALGIALAITMVSTTAFAQNGKGSKQAAKPAVAKAAKPKVQNMTMDPLEMEGGIGSPSGFIGTGNTGAKFGSFKLNRTSFYKEILRTTERF